MERKKYGPDAINTRSNWLTAMRIVAGGLLGYAAWKNHGKASLASAITFGAVVATDKVDGTWAQQDGPTRAGAFLDPLADKVLVGSEVFVLTSNGRYSPIVAGLLGILELDKTALRSNLATEGISLPASKLSKAKLVSQVADIFVRKFPLTAENKKITHATTTVATGLTMGSWLELRARAAKLRKAKKEESMQAVQELKAA